MQTKKKRYLDKPNWIWFVSRCAADAEENDWRRAMCLSFRRIIRWSIRCLKSQHKSREKKNILENVEKRGTTMYCAAHAFNSNKKTVKTIISIFTESLGTLVDVQRISFRYYSMSIVKWTWAWMVYHLIPFTIQSDLPVFTFVDIYPSGSPILQWKNFDMENSIWRYFPATDIEIVLYWYIWSIARALPVKLIFPINLFNVYAELYLEIASL